MTNEFMENSASWLFFPHVLKSSLPHLQHFPSVHFKQLLGRLKRASWKPEGDSFPCFTLCQRGDLSQDITHCFYVCSHCATPTVLDSTCNMLRQLHTCRFLSLTSVLLKGRSISCLLDRVHSDSTAQQAQARL